MSSKIWFLAEATPGDNPEDVIRDIVETSTRLHVNITLTLNDCPIAVIPNGNEKLLKEIINYE